MRVIAVAFVTACVLTLAFPVCALAYSFSADPDVATLNAAAADIVKPASSGAPEWDNSLFPASSERTWDFWFMDLEGQSGDWRTLFVKGFDEPTSYARSPMVLLRPSDNRVHLRSSASPPGTADHNFGFDPPTVYELNVWHHVAFSHTPSRFETYLNGVHVGGLNSPDVPQNNTYSLRLYSQYQSIADAYLTGITYHDYELTADEVRDRAREPEYHPILLPAWKVLDRDPRRARIFSAADNPLSVPIHPNSTYTLVIDSITTDGVTLYQDIKDELLGGGDSFDLTIYFYDDSTSDSRNDWVGLAVGTSARVNLGVYSDTTHYSYWYNGGLWTATSVSRSVGWHAFRFMRTALNSNMQLFIDGTQVFNQAVFTGENMDTIIIRGTINSMGYWSQFYTPREVSVPASVDLGAQSVTGGATAAQSVTIENTGGMKLTIESISVSGTHAGDFATSNGPSLPLTLNPGASTTIDVAFDPSGGGVRTASLDVVSDDLLQTTAPVALTGTGSDESPLLCYFDEAASRRFYKPSVGDTCPGSPDTSNSCYFDVAALATDFPTTLRIDGADPDFGDPESRLENDGTDDRIYLAFDVPTKYYGVSLVFDDATDCGTWTLEGVTPVSTDKADCYSKYEFSQVWADAYASDGSKCGWNRTVDGADVQLTLDVGLNFWEDLEDSRGTTLRREHNAKHPVVVEFPTQVVAQTTDVQVFSPVRTLAAVVGQSVTVDESTDPDTATLTVTLSTEVQAPFELHGITSNTVAPGITLVTTLNGANDVNVRQEAECTNSAVDCANTWQIQYSTQTTTKPCNFNGGYSVDFTIRCSDESDTNCPIDDATDSVTVSFTLASSDHCPTVIDSIVLSAELKVYDAPQRVTDADDFVGDGLQDDGQTAVNEGDADQWQVAYFTAPTTSSQVAILETEFNQVWVERGAAADVTLLDKDNSLGGGAVACTATAYADADDTASCGTEAGLDDTTCQLVVPDIAFPDKCGAFDFAHRKGTSAAAGESSIPWFEFDINTSASGFNLANDAIETMTVHAVIDVSYANAAKRVAGSTQQTRRQSTNVAASISAGQTGTAASSSSSSATLFGMNAMVVYAGAAVVAIVAVAAIVVSSRRRSNNLTKLQSTTELTTTSTAV